jgi:protein-tyrosine phosphatase
MKINELGLIPIRNFGVVSEENNIYRSAQPLYGYEYAWLSNMLGLKHIINLRIESKHDNMLSSNYGITVHDFDVIDHFPPSVEIADNFTSLIKELVEKKEPLLFHCEHGHGRTSTFCVLTQVTLGMTLEEAVDEEEKKFHYQFKHHGQYDFLEQYFKTLIPS